MDNVGGVADQRQTRAGKLLRELQLQRKALQPLFDRHLAEARAHRGLDLGGRLVERQRLEPGGLGGRLCPHQRRAVAAQRQAGEGAS